ncbi:hypothetical protein KCH_23220 [Kitasatospora cheerisanensis KCTC 2395]|uniref:Uncharacterized protein n=1 Tax=Kitasatospora cheerisanensis KCTC 2395 TaxID=1348663 RepID=A0A066Z6F2_9ACTN|nr:hypothetical protein KCH_23220 [Kitasatospora cheerisanensis KCTC 2395]
MDLGRFPHGREVCQTRCGRLLILWLGILHRLSPYGGRGRSVFEAHAVHCGARVTGGRTGVWFVPGPLGGRGAGSGHDSI